MKTKKASPQVKQTFSFTAPGANHVMLAGDFTQWQSKAIPMKPDKSGVWKATVSLPPGTHHYRFIVDGQWRDDPACTLRIPNPYGGDDCVREVT